MVEENPILDQSAIEEQRGRPERCEEKVKRVVMAIEEGGPISVLVEQLRKLQDEKSEAEFVLERLLFVVKQETQFDDLIERLEKAKTEPEKLMPFRNNAVPGTGADDVANNQLLIGSNGKDQNR